jgi:cholesterol transport system auxiliary component
MTTRRAAAIHLAWLTSGCTSLLAPADVSGTTALIDILPADVPRAPTARGVLLVAMPTCRPVYDTTRMAYRLREHQVDFFARHEWAERPAQMLQPLLVRTLERARCCTAVVTPPATSGYDFVLRTELRELVQDFAVRPPRLHLALRVTIGERSRTLATHDVEIAQPLLAENAEAGVSAANIAAAAALRTIAQHVVDALA